MGVSIGMRSVNQDDNEKLVEPRGFEPLTS